MFLPRQLDKYTNYNGYIVEKRLSCVHEVEHTRICNLIKKLCCKYKNPYVRFMWMTKEGVNEALCVVYSDYKKNERLTKLIPFSEAEKIIDK